MTTKRERVTHEVRAPILRGDYEDGQHPSDDEFWKHVTAEYGRR